MSPDSEKIVVKYNWKKVLVTVLVLWLGVLMFTLALRWCIDLNTPGVSPSLSKQPVATQSASPSAKP